MRELLAAGYDQEQILAYFERSYGEFVRLEPPLRGVNWLVWLAPAGWGCCWASRSSCWALRPPKLAAAPGRRPSLPQLGGPPGATTLPDDPGLARPTSLKVRELAYGWPGGVAAAQRALLMGAGRQSTGALARLVLAAGLLIAGLVVALRAALGARRGRRGRGARCRSSCATWSESATC